jgi:Fe2+ transport system protein FeoA
MKENEICKIVTISENCSLKHRLGELGISKGQKIECKNIGISHCIPNMFKQACHKKKRRPKN